MTEFLSDPKWVGVGAMSAVLTLLLYTLVERSKLGEPLKFMGSFAVKGLVVLSPGLILASVLFLFFAMTPLPDLPFVSASDYISGYVAIVSFVVLPSFPAFPAVAALKLQSSNSTAFFAATVGALLGAGVGAIGGMVFFLFMETLSHASSLHGPIEEIEAFVGFACVEVLIGALTGLATVAQGRAVQHMKAGDSISSNH